MSESSTAAPVNMAQIAADLARERAPAAPTMDDLVMDATAFIQQDLGELEWLIEGLIPEAGTAAFIGKEKSGKSTVALQMALCVQHGIPFMGRTTRKANVLFHDEEGSAKAWQRRIRTTATGLGIHANDLGLLFLHRKQVTYTDKQRIAELRQLIEKHDLGLVIIGPLRQVADIEDENKSTEINRLMRELNRLAEETNVSIVVLHHPRKSGKTADRIPSIGDFFEASAGNNALQGAVDAGIGILRPDDDQPNDGLLYWRTREPANGRPSMGKEPFSYNPENNLIAPGVALFNAEDHKDRTILDHLYELGWQSKVEIGATLRLQPHSAGYRCDRLVQDGLLRRKEGKRKKLLYDLAEDQRQKMAADRGEDYIATDDLGWIEETLDLDSNDSTPETQA